ncbi:MAG: mannosyltransferase family protein [Bdellovibrionota bacterium]
MNVVRAALPTEETQPITPSAAISIGESFRAAAFSFLLSRALVFSLFLLCAQLHFVPTAGWERQEASAVIRFDPTVAAQQLKQIWQSGDSHFYLQIATQGYDPSESSHTAMRNWVFFPLFPLSIRALSSIVGHPLFCAIALANFWLFATLIVLHRLALVRGLSSEAADRVVIAVALNPLSYLFSCPMTETTFFFLATSSALALERRRPIIAGCIAAFATACRPTGLLLLPAFALGAYGSSRFHRHRLATTGVSLALASSGLVAYATFLWYRAGDPLIFIHNQHFWDRSGSFFTLLQGIDPRNISTGWNFVWLNAAAVFFGFSCAVRSIRRRRVYDALVYLVPTAALLSSGTVLSAYRVLMPLFPGWLMVGELSRSKLVWDSILVVFAALLGILTVAYSLGVTSALV